MRDNHERNYLREHKECEYCAAMGARRQSEVVISRQIGESEYLVAICWEHYKKIIEIESEEWI